MTDKPYTPMNFPDDPENIFVVAVTERDGEPVAALISYDSESVAASDPGGLGFGLGATWTVSEGNFEYPYFPTRFENYFTRLTFDGDEQVLSGSASKSAIAVAEQVSKALGQKVSIGADLAVEHADRKVRKYLENSA